MGAFLMGQQKRCWDENEMFDGFPIPQNISLHPPIHCGTHKKDIPFFTGLHFKEAKPTAQEEAVTEEEAKPARPVVVASKQ